MSKILCPQCGSIREATIATREETYPFRGESITTVHEFSVCVDCGTDVATAAQMDRNLSAIREAYRTRHELVTPEEIRKIRNRYGAGQKPFGIILGLGESTIANYERGDVPTAANSTLIQLMADVETFRRVFDQRKDHIGSTQRKRIEDRIKNNGFWYATDAQALVAREMPDEYTGFRNPDADRMVKLLGWILVLLGESVFKTKLLKLAFLSETEYFRRHTVSITGWPYARLPHGPVPQEYKVLLDTAEQDGYLVSEDYDDGKTTLKAGPRSARVTESDTFSADEADAVQEVVARWRTASPTQLSDFTHTLSAWKNTANAKEISFAALLEDSVTNGADPARFI